jgi:hypothetical protein
VDELVRALARIGETRDACKVLAVKLEGRKPLVKPRSQWEDYTKMDLHDMGWDDISWIHLAKDKDQ